MESIHVNLIIVFDDVYVSDITIMTRLDKFVVMENFEWKLGKEHRKKAN